MREFKIGDKVFSTEFGKGKVTKIDTPDGNPNNDNYPIGVTFLTDFNWYTVDGHYWSNKADNKDIKHINDINTEKDMKCTTQAEVFTELARVAKLIEGTDLTLGNVVKGAGCNIDNLNDIKTYPPKIFTFALALVEGKPVFAGDKLWSNFSNKEVTIKGTTVYKDNLYLTHVNNAGDEGDTCLDKLTWKQPKKTFTLNGIELPLPDDTCGKTATALQLYYIPSDVIPKYRWNKGADRDKVMKAITDLLDGVTK